MSSISSTKALAGSHNFAGRAWYYDFRDLESTFDEEACKRVAAYLSQLYAKITKPYSANLNSEWVCRLFMSAKLIMAATIHVNAMLYSRDRNLRVVIPYLRYYSVLSLLRSICYTLPDVPWNNGKLISISHSAAIRGAIAHLERFSPTRAKAIKRQVLLLKAERELISYRAPSSGDSQISGVADFIGLCTLLAETAQFNSEVFESSLLKHAGHHTFDLLDQYIEQIASVFIDGHYFGDMDDARRLDYLSRKHPRPANIMHLMTEGHVDDFFGSWCAEDDQDGLFNPDDMSTIIFDIP